MKKLLLALSVAFLAAFTISVSAYNPEVSTNEIEHVVADTYPTTIEDSNVIVENIVSFQAEETVVAIVENEDNQIVNFILQSDLDADNTIENTDAMTFANMYKYMEEIGLPNRDVAIRQIIVHNAWNESNIKNNNVFAMKQPKHRNTLSVGIDDNGFATYENWREAIVDYKLWQAHFKISFDTDMPTYIKSLTAIGYCENTAAYAKSLFELNTNRLAQQLL